MLKKNISPLKKNKIVSTTLQRRLFFFLLFVTVFLILLFTVLLLLFGINGTEEQSMENYLSSELNYISKAIDDDFGTLSVDGINLAEEISASSDTFFREHDITAAELANRPELIEPLLAIQMQTLLNRANTRICGGTFILLDASIDPDAENADSQKAGIFIKKTQPTFTETVGVNMYYLRGPAQIARDNKIGLIGQWMMEYNIEGEEFFNTVMDTARQNPDLALSRLYYWSQYTVLENNSEAGFLLCIPLRSADGTVFGVCGYEVSDRMFKTLYSPHTTDYQSTFAIAAPFCNNCLQTSHGLIAGNTYLTGHHINEPLLFEESEDNFQRFVLTEESFRGLSTSLHLYPSGSPYETQTWTLAVLMPETVLHDAVRGNFTTFLLIIVIVLVISIGVSVLISRRYLSPVKNALHSIHNNNYDHSTSTPYLEINDLFAFLNQKDKEHEEKLKILDAQKQSVQEEYDKAQIEVKRLAYERKKEVDPLDYNMFLDNLHTLTPKEEEIFNLYLSGKTVKEIMTETNINENTLKYHNKNIYSKLGVNSRKQLLRYAALMKQNN